MTSKKIGRITLFKYSAISMIICIATPILIVIIIKLISNEPINISTFYENIMKDIQGNELIIFIQIFVMAVFIWLIGGLSGQLIIDHNSNKFVTGFLTFFTLWLILLLSVSFSFAISHSFKYGIKGFQSALINGLVYGMFIFLSFGIINGLLFGYLFSKEIKKKETH